MTTPIKSLAYKCQKLTSFVRTVARSGIFCIPKYFYWDEATSSFKNHLAINLVLFLLHNFYLGER